MEDSERDKRILEFVTRFCCPTSVGLMDYHPAGFDTSKPNAHDSKPEFLAEHDAVNKALSDATGLFDFLYSAFRDEGEEHKELARRLENFIDTNARASAKTNSTDSAVDLVLSNARTIGVSYVAMFMALDIKTALIDRNQELKDQEKAFWSGRSRPPNHYARTIALRFARLSARETGKRPNFGTARDGGHPSTEFGRALQEIFEILNITAKVKGPATWAIGQLTNEDLKPRARNSFAGLMGTDWTEISALRIPGNALLDLVPKVRSQWPFLRYSNCVSFTLFKKISIVPIGPQLTNRSEATWQACSSKIATTSSVTPNLIRSTTGKNWRIGVTRA